MRGVAWRETLLYVYLDVYIHVSCAKLCVGDPV